MEAEGSRLRRWKLREAGSEDESQGKQAQKMEAEGSRLRRWKLREAGSDDVCIQRLGRE